VVEQQKQFYDSKIEEILATNKSLKLYVEELVKSQMDNFESFKFETETKFKKSLEALKSEFQLSKQFKGIVYLDESKAKENYNSQLLKPQSYKLVAEWMNYKKPVLLGLLYRSTEDKGLSAQDFHRKCDDKEATITFIKTNQNHIVGGFTEKSWDCSNEVKDDPKAFLFSITNNKKYKYKKDGTAIRCLPQQLSSFGTNDLVINPRAPLHLRNMAQYGYNLGITNGTPSTSNPGSFEIRAQNNYNELTSGINSFEISEIEVYQVNVL